MVSRVDETTEVWCISCWEGKEACVGFEYNELTVIFPVFLPLSHLNVLLLRDQEVTPRPHCDDATNKKTESSGYANIPW